MRKRKYIRVTDIMSRTDGKGVPFAVRIFGKNTSVMAVDRNQKDDKIGFVIDFTDLKFGIASKYDIKRGGNLVPYASDLYEQDSKEEFYKVALILTKQSLKRQIKMLRQLIKKYDAGKYAWPITSKNIKSYRKSLEQDIKAAASIDTTEKDLQFFKEYIRD